MARIGGSITCIQDFFGEIDPCEHARRVFLEEAQKSLGGKGELSRLNPEKLHVYFDDVLPDTFRLPRRYTLTHSDRTGDLYLTIGSDFDHDQISGLYTRFMRDEVLAEWKTQQGAFVLFVNCHVCGGLVFGTASMRESIFRREMPLVLEAIACGERELLSRISELRQAEILVRFQRPKLEECTIESWGHVEDFSFR